LLFEGITTFTIAAPGGTIMENAREDAPVERIPSAFFREALDLALEAVKARRLAHNARESSGPPASNRRQHRRRRLPKKSRSC
jgi:hypothetical protein